MNDERMRVLIVDDEQDIGKIISKIFIQKGIYCEVANTVGDALAIMDKDTFDIYFFDINLPDGSGFDLASSLNQNKGNARTVMISAFDGDEEKEKARKLEVDHFISKPFSKKQILEIIE